jgi:hypothetical protein
VLYQLRRRCPRLLPSAEHHLLKMLESVRHFKRHPNVDESRGRPRRWPREDVRTVAQKLNDTLERKTGGRVSASSFVSLYLPILRYPTDVTDALGAGEINIREAAYMARLTAERLKCSLREARQERSNLLKAHLLTKGSQSSLRQRVKAALGELPAKEPNPGKSGRQKADELIMRNPHDARHLFFEEIQQLVEMMGEIGPEDLKGKTLVEFLRQLDRLLAMLRRLKQGHSLSRSKRDI